MIITSVGRLVAKTQLTHDVFSLTFAFEQELHVIPGQFFAFILPDNIRRSYSASFCAGKEASFIIKRIPDGKGSPLICDLPIGESLTIMGPLGRFLLTSASVPKLFLGTGTGFAPLFFQIKHTLEHTNEKVFLAFGVRHKEDLFYVDVLQEMKKHAKQFDFSFFVSREEVPNMEKGYITECLTSDFVCQFGEFYMCGSPAMVRDVRCRLAGFWISPTCIFFEQY